MNIDKALQFFDNYKKGTYTNVTKATNKDGFTKVVSMVVRFVNYYNIKENKEANKKPIKKDYEKNILPHILKENINTNNILLLVYLTKNQQQKAKTTYFYNGQIITEAEYYAGIKENKKPAAPSCVLSFKLADVVSIGGVKNE